MGSRRRWWWTGVLLFGAVVNCSGRSVNTTGPEGAAGESGSGAPHASGGGAFVGGERPGGAGGSANMGLGGEESVGGSDGVAGAGLGGEIGVKTPISIELPGEANVVAADCSGAVADLDVEPALARFCLLAALCENESLATCVWDRARFERAGACAAEVETCTDLEACSGSPPAIYCSAVAAESCNGSVLASCYDDDEPFERDCAETGLDCVEYWDEGSRIPRAKCMPASCDHEYDELEDHTCNGDHLLSRSAIVGGGFDESATVRLHCPDFGFTTCSAGRCVY